MRIEEVLKWWNECDDQRREGGVERHGHELAKASPECLDGVEQFRQTECCRETGPEGRRLRSNRVSGAPFRIRSIDLFVLGLIVRLDFVYRALAFNWVPTVTSRGT